MCAWAALLSHLIISKTLVVRFWTRTSFCLSDESLLIFLYTSLLHLTSYSVVSIIHFCGQIEKPTDEQIDEWHKKYTSELQRLFSAYKHVRADYKNKDLRITEK
jgi:hypothetical protein